ncbi:Mog1p/PsbP-like protein [Xylona heveae TC161]|uniref:Mog1p/PsbP-like protein n=1 Tax=Xylona heveae (strain CBS 132557 / TC161) TaxID=1328760 RepID=A0A164ZBR5_XYLHT|nr:Mog1p/PsbP-like protein [Xylona heveae TC161]KZF18907.1 Mog1p/PsbP-like protein [Xylona heveae TC161]
MATFRHTDLFGGTIVADLPSAFVDASNIRQVPDHQEVYLDKDGYTSIIFEITERVNDFNTDEEALSYHLQDIAEADEGLNILSSSTAHLPSLPDDTPAYTILATQEPIAGHQVSRLSIRCTALLLTLVRLEKQSADLLISINVPLLKEEFPDESVDLENGEAGTSLNAAMAYRERVLATLEIKDWSLFV